MTSSSDLEMQSSGARMELFFVAQRGLGPTPIGQGWLRWSPCQKRWDHRDARELLLVGTGR